MWFLVVYNKDCGFPTALWKALSSIIPSPILNNQQRWHSRRLSHASTTEKQNGQPNIGGRTTSRNRITTPTCHLLNLDIFPDAR